jgi:hypothetical protein
LAGGRKGAPLLASASVAQKIGSEKYMQIKHLHVDVGFMTGKCRKTACNGAAVEFQTRVVLGRFDG